MGIASAVLGWIQTCFLFLKSFIWRHSDENWFSSHNHPSFASFSPDHDVSLERKHRKPSRTPSTDRLKRSHDAINRLGVGKLKRKKRFAVPLIGELLEHRYNVRLLRSRMLQASTYDEYMSAAVMLDRATGNLEWKQDPSDVSYDHAVIQQRLARLRHYAQHGDYESLVLALRSGLLRNLGGMGNEELYDVCYTGTKHLIEDYTMEVAQQLKMLCVKELAWFNPVAKLSFFKETAQAYGRTALLLSGGATLGMYHLGVVKALIEANMLPNVISGSSAGALVASLLCTRTDDELPSMFGRGYLRFDAFGGSHKGSLKRKLNRLLTKGYLMDITILEECTRDNVGDITFKEAFDKTGRILNITVASTTRHEVPRLLNYLTAPHVLIWSAAIASCALKGLFPPVELMAKDSKGNIRLYHPYGVKWSDGSVESDLPMRRLSELFNINHYIVSQVNPHVAPFLRGGRKTVWSSLGQAIKYLMESEFKHRITQIAELGLFPSMMKWLQPAITQPYEGDITIVPRIRWEVFKNIISNPDADLQQKCIEDGEKATWPHISMLTHHCLIEIVLRECVNVLERRVDEER